MANIIGYGDQMVKLEAYGDQLVGPVPLPSSPEDLESIYNALVAKGITPASESLSDILTAINTIVVPSGKYTYPSGSTGGDVDVTNYAQVNAANVYAKGKADGGSGKKTISVSNVTNPSWDGTNTHAITWSATSGYVYAVAIGGTNGYTSSWSASGATILGQYTSYNSSYKTGATICILQATSTSVTATYSGTWPYQGAGTVFRIAI